MWSDMRQGLLFLGLALVLLGFALVFAGSLASGQVSTGGFVLIGPFPIVFGTGGNGGILALLSVALGLVMLFLLFATVAAARSARRRENA
jgi:uncharacterized membrane protein